MIEKIRVMKFGGTSVGDATCIRRAAEIVALAAHDGQLVVVVSAMSGVTNRLIKAAQASATGDMRVPNELAEALRTQHHSAIAMLVNNDSTREQLTVELDQLIDEVADLCRGTALLR